MSQEESKLIVKEALKEWLDEKFATFGKWSLTTFSALLLTAIVYFTLKTTGWTFIGN